MIVLAGKIISQEEVIQSRINDLMKYVPKIRCGVGNLVEQGSEEMKRMDNQRSLIKIILERR
jgi:hypothetical protein